MKIYEELSKEDKQKLRDYWMIKGNLQLRLSALVIVIYMGIFIGFPLCLTLYPSLFVAGTYILITSAVLCLVVVLRVQQDTKYLQLAFGMENSMEELFKIKKSDIRDMRRVWKKKED